MEQTIIEYKPTIFNTPKKLIKLGTAWVGLESIIYDILVRFNINTNIALEFGVEWGFSTAAFANYFTQVVGVDTFTGDIHSGVKQCHLNSTKENLKDFDNIVLIKSDYKEFIKNNKNRYNLIHVDIVHDYEHTYECGLWSVNHSDVTLFHDTVSFNDVNNAVKDICKLIGKTYYNYPKHYGLGIIV